MSKPILWLGPLEELDPDFDPLLGRSANQAQPAPVAPRVALDPSRSVFDDPAEVIPAAPPPTEVLEAAPIAETVVAPEPVVAPIAQDNPPVAPPTVDFTFNNDPIPERGEVAAPVDLMPLEEDAPKKSFFGRLFTKKTIAPAAVLGGASINEIWAKAEPEPTPEPEPQASSEPTTIAELEDVATASGVDAPVVSVEAEPVVPEPEPAPDVEPAAHGNIWANIDEEIDQASEVAPAGTEVVTDAQALPASDPEAASTELSETVEPTPVPEADQAERVDASEPPVQTENKEAATDPVETISDTEQVDDPQTEPSASRETVDEAPLAEPETVEPTIAEAQAPTPEPSISAKFQDAFNADNFWAIPPGHKAAQDQSNTPESKDTETSPADEPMAELIATDVANEPNEISNEAPQPAEVASEAVPSQAAPRPRPAGTAKRRKKKAKKNYVGAFFGTFFFGVAAIMTAVSTLAAFGYPWDMLSSYRWYWTTLAVVAAGIFGLSRGWRMVAASFLVMGINLFVTVPASGKAPTGGKTATAVIGWANVAENGEALARVFKDADKRQATLLMVAEAPQSVLTPPAGWTLIEAPLANDPTAIAVLSKSSWRAATVPGEPTMARPPAGDLTVIGVHPQDALKSRRKTPMRDALINRAGTRAGIQEGPTIVVGDFNAAPWDKAMNQFREYGNITRVRCGGWAGATLNQAFGLIGVATDHAYVRDVDVTHCRLGGALPGGQHKPIWLYVAPKAPVPAEK